MRHEVRCSQCGVMEVVMKTCRRRAGGEHLFALCDGCHAEVAPLVWIVAGPDACFGTCRSCSEWFSVRELEDLSGGGKYDAPIGLCAACKPLSNAWRAIALSRPSSLLGVPREERRTQKREEAGPRSSGPASLLLARAPL